MNIKQIGGLAVLLLMSVLALPTLAQDNGGPPGGPGGGGGPGGPGGGPGGFGGPPGGFDPAAFRQQMMDRIKQQMGATDEEFSVLQPKIQTVMDAQRDAGGGGRGRGPGGPGGPGGFGPPPDGRQPSPTQQAASDLRQTLDDQNASADQIKAKLDAYRDARTKAKATLEAAQKDLLSILTQRQEAVLALMGLLE